MDVEEVRDKASFLKGRITALLNEFEQETDTTITDFKIVKLSAMDLKSPITSVEFEAKIW